MSNDRDLSGGKPLPMTVHNVGFLLDRLGKDCAPLQFLRELTQNGIEAIERTGSPGEIVWDVDWMLYDLGDPPLMKVCIIDNGDGMTGAQMQQFINQLSSSGADQAFDANYGVGAKIAAVTRNPAGIIYQSWQNGEGAMIQLLKEDGQYGLKQWELSDGTFSHFMPLDNDVKPPEIKDNGTKVVLIGREEDQDTMTPPPEAASPSRWISKYLNTRYFRFPENTTVRAREGWDFPRNDSDRNVLRRLTGQKAYLDSHAIVSGVHKLNAVNVHWWILKDENALTNNSGYIESAGHVAALYQNELYDRATSRSGTSLLQQFGVLFGQRQVVLYAEPLPDDANRLTTNTARTTLLLNDDKLPWADWAVDFRSAMPKELADFVQERASAVSEKDHLKSIKDRLKSIMDLYKVSRYRPVPQGVYLSDPASAVSVTASPDTSSRSKGGGGRSSSVSSSATTTKDGGSGNIYHLFEKKGGVQSEKTKSDPFPEVTWVTIKDGSRSDDDMEDKAAKYLESQNHLLINADFRVFDDMVSKLTSARDNKGGVDISHVVSEVVHGWFEQALVETVIGIIQLRNRKEWGPEEISRALSEEALTSCVMQRYHVFNACKRDLGAKLGKMLDAETV